jgi:polyisoprenyl-phosphate glycosyltransferase
MSAKILSLIVPCYNEEQNIQYAYSEIVRVCTQHNINYEILFVDDGSIDNTILEIEALQKKDKGITLIEFSRNFGKEMATSAGINECKGDGCIIVDADMQYPIDAIPEFVEKWHAGADVVVGIRDKKKTNNLIERLGSFMFYKISAVITEVDIIPGALDFRLMDRKVINEFKRFNERGRMTRVLVDWLGFKREYVSYKENSRKFGVPAYSFAKRLSLAINTFIATSLVPLKMAWWLGLMITSISGLVGVFVITVKYILNDPWDWNITGSASVGLFNLFLTGIILMGLGVIAVYIGTMHTEILDRPIYIIRRKK